MITKPIRYPEELLEEVDKERRLKQKVVKFKISFSEYMRHLVRCGLAYEERERKEALKRHGY